MLKIWTSYFYQLRNFTENVIPLSTAIWDPKWYHNFRSADYVYLDKRGVINGLRIFPLVPGKELSGLCYGYKDCNYNPYNCEFLRRYKEQLNNIDFTKFISSLNDCVSSIRDKGWVSGDLEVALLFHEAPNNSCSERMEVIKWFHRNNYPIEEWVKEQKSD